MMRKLTPSGAFGFYAALCFFGWIAVIICYPECSNMTLEETREVFKHGSGVKYAEQWRKEHRAKLRARKDMEKEAFGGMHPISGAET
jgi:MFS transporter, SP family, solute carrier family 2 (myo-inositol transporter), member 13